MFSRLGYNSIVYIFDIKGSPKILTGILKKVSLPRPKHVTFNPTMEMVVDLTVEVNGEDREFKGVPDSTIADFGNDSFILASSKDSLSSYIVSARQASKKAIDRHEHDKEMYAIYDEAFKELNPEIKVSENNDKAIQTLKEQMQEMKDSIAQLLEAVTKKGDTKI